MMEISASDMQVQSPPRAEEPEYRNDKWVFQCLGLKIAGGARLGNAPPRKLQPVVRAATYPVGAGWRVGWVQVNVQERRWALFGGPGQGQTVLQEWPGYTVLDTADDAGRDLFCSLQRPFYAPLTETSPGRVEFVDLPINEFPARLDAGAGGGALSAIGLRLSFVCGLAVRAPDDALYVLQWVPWYVEWSYDFAGGPAGPVARRLPAGTNAAAGGAQTGCPEVLRAALAGPRGGSANIAAGALPTSTVLNGPQVASRLQSLRNRGGGSR